jgi:hypothetical protein
VLRVMGELGNSLVNRIYLAKVDVLEGLGVEKATPTSTRYASVLGYLTVQ